MSQTTKAKFEESAVFFSGNVDFLEQAYEAYLRGEPLEAQWQAHFDALQAPSGADVSHEGVRRRVLQAVNLRKTVAPSVVGTQQDTSWQVSAWVEAYRQHGHRAVQLDPLGLIKPEPVAALAPATYGLRLDQQVDGRLVGLAASVSVADMEAALRRCYTQGVGIEYQHIESESIRTWLSDFMQSPEHRMVEQTTAKAILDDLARAEGMEHFLANRFVGQKRFSLEGNESLIPLLNQIIACSAQVGVEEVAMGMAHRGRLNVMLNVLGMSSQALCDRFSGAHVSEDTSGDVKYHLGYTSNRTFGDKSVHLSLGFNPSHLEFIVPVVMGASRAKQTYFYQHAPEKVLPIAIHGDAAIAGQGVVAEWFNMMEVPAHNTQGAIHIVVNNQIGFTAESDESRSSRYPTDLVKRSAMPILHINGDDLSAVLFAARLAAAYRDRFQRSIMINLVGYRRLGHNEADDPSLTQPVMYQAIKKQPSALKVWGQACVAHHGLSEQAVKAVSKQVHQQLVAGQALVAIEPPSPSIVERSARWSDYLGHSDQLRRIDTQVDAQVVSNYIKGLSAIPEGFVPHRQVAKIAQSYQAVLLEKGPIQWGLAENLAYASLLDEGFSVRLVGQDAGRGTFGHRHAQWHDSKNGQIHTPLLQWQSKERPFNVYNSVLSELAVVGFEYGYATVDPKSLVIWEAQFGDFANGAQVILDQFISSGWQKWQRMCGLVLLLPHGYEGQGPEHSSARLERYLQLCAQENMRVCVPSTPAQMFHLLRMQMHSPVRRPLIVMTPKSLLRHPEAVNVLSDFSAGGFSYVLPEVERQKKSTVRRVILCSGKVYYDLLQHRVTNQIKNIALVRIEQLYPFPEKDVMAVLAQYRGLKEVVWCQEEPRNQGAWHAIRHFIEKAVPDKMALHCISRDALASPAAGYVPLHKARQERLIQAAFAPKLGV